ncbi:hypothetical protein ACVIHI_004952 [Bradyrhizobium sp. USDA 4524]|uniref:hypothetical protein n=1 Tax=unclassified Bradyrhizobium TaxID=2631580 RepID=UPI0020A00513|nr:MULTISPECIES: hypothetical protein [unclassified Bradyrhizobium]MCP1842129.1 hypothetical protein [Bradyrhizobium sp. USDA 4538]MCP1902693.1 hypothetical protein [Bradyrhizobium sp. USDA 4537]MCP1991650.1 hypothetical protein [Bradyrhizobium sp. USDA 4539]
MNGIAVARTRTVKAKMAAPNDPPYSSTVSSVIDAFLRRLEDHKTIAPASLAALRQALADHKLDAESLREAIFTPAEQSDDSD